MTVREDLAAAASTVDGISCAPFYRQTTKPGDAMVRLARIEYPNVLGGMVTWQVVVLMPADFAAAEKFLDDKLPALVDALSAYMIVNSATPAQLQLENGTVPAVFIEGQREE